MVNNAPVNDDFLKHINNINELRSWLEGLKYTTEGLRLMNQPIISVLIHATEYMNSNLTILSKRIK